MNWRWGVISYLFTLLHTEETIPSGCVHTAALMCFPDHFYCYVTLVGIENKSALELSWKHIGFWIPFEGLIIGSISQKYCLSAIKNSESPLWKRLLQWRDVFRRKISRRYRIAFTCKFSCFLFQDPDQADMAFLRPWGVKITIRASTWNRHTHLDIVSPGPVSKDRVYKCN